VATQFEAQVAAASISVLDCRFLIESSSVLVALRAVELEREF
jgi:hypothetical protein|tara:strand:+ start:334 stop:459 length:126 start_codon:yes stop_codon:yes gene_type:complete